MSQTSSDESSSSPRQPIVLTMSSSGELTNTLKREKLKEHKREKSSGSTGNGSKASARISSRIVELNVGGSLSFCPSLIPFVPFLSFKTNYLL